MKTLCFAIVTICLAGPLTAQAVVPNDPMFEQQWHLKKIGATNAWNTTTGTTNIVVALFDIGVDYTHPDIAANMWRNPGETGLDVNGHDKATNGIDDDGNGYVDDVHGINVWDGTGDPMDRGWNEPPEPNDYHGTGCAGVIGAIGDNHLGISGVNWSVKIMAITVMDQSKGTNASPPQHFTTSGMLAAWNYVIDMKRRGVNVRVTSHSEALTAYSPAVRDAITTAYHEGILSIVAADNFVVNLDTFSQYSNVQNMEPLIYVAATDESDRLAWFSNYGKSTVHLAAPGVNILTLTAGTDYRVRSGTSFACPLVAGSAALLLAAKPDATVDEVKAALLGSVDRIASLRDKVMTGGRLNLGRAITLLTNANPPAIVLTALPAGQRTPTNLPIHVTFSRAMDRASVESALIVTPPVSGAFEWSPDNRSFSFIHDAPFDPATSYTVRILGSAQDTTGGKLDGNFNQTQEGSPADDFLWTFRFPVPNDNFADAQPLAGASGAVQGNNRFTIWEEDEPSEPNFYDLSYFYGVRLLASVWYRWTPPASGGPFTFDLTSGTAFDSYLGIYVGDQPGDLIRVASNDNYGSRTASRVSFQAEAGTNYSIQVVGINRFSPLEQVGPFQLKWYPTPAPGFTGAQLSSASGVPGTKVTLIGTNFTGATAVLFNGVSATFTNAPTNNMDLRITAFVPPAATSGPIAIVTPHGNVTSTASFQVFPPPLTIRMIGASELEISWPASSPEFVLEASEQVQGAVWTPCPEKPVVGIDGSSVTLEADRRSRFLRLRKQSR